MRKFIILLPVIALALASCDDAVKKAEDMAAEKMAESMGVEDVDITTNADGSKNVSVEQGGTKWQSGENVPMPEGFPSDIPSYPGWKIVAAASAGPQGFLVSAKSGDKMDKIARFYSDTLKAKGWKSSAMSQTADAHFLTFEKEARTASVMLTKDSSDTMVQLTASGG